MQLYGRQRHAVWSSRGRAGDGEAHYVGQLAERLLQCLLPCTASQEPETGFLLLESDVGRIFARELIAHHVLLPLTNLLAQPATIVRLLSLLVESVSPAATTITTGSTTNSSTTNSTSSSSSSSESPVSQSSATATGSAVLGADGTSLSADGLTSRDTAGAVDTAGQERTMTDGSTAATNAVSADNTAAAAAPPPAAAAAPPPAAAATAAPPPAAAAALAVPLLAQWTHVDDYQRAERWRWSLWPEDECHPALCCAGGDLAALLRNSHQLYAFTQWLQRRRALAQLQFCMAVDAFHERLLCPELTLVQLRRLHCDLVSLYTCHLAPGAADLVCLAGVPLKTRDGSGGATTGGAAETVVDIVERVIGGAAEGVIRLQKMSELFAAYELVFRRLERHRAAAFATSGELIDSVLRRSDTLTAAFADGTGVAAGWRGQFGARRGAQLAGAVTRWGRRLRDVIRVPTVNGRADTTVTVTVTGGGGGEWPVHCRLATDIDETGVDCTEALDAYRCTASSVATCTTSAGERGAADDYDDACGTGGADGVEDAGADDSAVEEEESDDDDDEDNYDDEDDEGEDPDADEWPVDDNLNLWTVRIARVSMARDRSGKLSIVFVLDVASPWLVSSSPAPAAPAAVGSNLPISASSLTSLSQFGPARDQWRAADGKRWLVARHMHEFYVLQRRLCEFHGDLAGVGRLPPRHSLLQPTSFSSSSFYSSTLPLSPHHSADYLESRSGSFVTFLRQLMAAPALSHSQLVRSFLTTSQPFSDTSDDFIGSLATLADINLVKIIRTVPKKFRKERGQYLEPFLTALVASTGVPLAPAADRLPAADDQDLMLPSPPPSAAVTGATRAGPSAGCSTVLVCSRAEVEPIQSPRGTLTDTSLFYRLLVLLCRLLEHMALAQETEAAAGGAGGWLGRLGTLVTRCVLAVACGLRQALEKPLHWLTYRWLARQLIQLQQQPALGCRLVQLAEEAIFDTSSSHPATSSTATGTTAPAAAGGGGVSATVAGSDHSLSRHTRRHSQVTSAIAKSSSLPSSSSSSALAGSSLSSSSVGAGAGAGGGTAGEAGVRQRTRCGTWSTALQHTRHLSYDSAELQLLVAATQHQQHQQLPRTNLQSSSQKLAAAAGATSGSCHSLPSSSPNRCSASTNPVASAADDCTPDQLCYQQLTDQLTSCLSPAAAVATALLTGCRWQATVQLLLDCTRSPVVNKQLVYVLVDQLVAVMFPELSRADAPLPTQHHQ